MACCCSCPTPKRSLAESTGLKVHTFSPLQQAISGLCLWRWFWVWRVERAMCKGAGMSHARGVIGSQILQSTSGCSRGWWTRPMRLSAIWNPSASTAMWQPGYAAIFDIGRAVSNAPSLISSSIVTHCSITMQHPPTSRGSGKIPPKVGE